MKSKSKRKQTAKPQAGRKIEAHQTALVSEASQPTLTPTPPAQPKPKRVRLKEVIQHYPSVELSPKQFQFLRGIADRDKTVQQVMKELKIPLADLAKWWTIEKFQRHLARDQEHAALCRLLERKLSKSHATETIARIARGQEVGNDTRLALQASIHIINATKKKQTATTDTVPLVEHDDETARQLLGALKQAEPAQPGKRASVVLPKP